MGSGLVHSSVKVGDGKKKPRSANVDFFFGGQSRLDFFFSVDFFFGGQSRLDFFFAVGEKKTRGEVQSRVGARAIPLGLR